MFKYSILYSHQYGFLDKIIEGVNKDNTEYTIANFLDLKNLKFNHYGFRNKLIIYGLEIILQIELNT